MKRPLFFSFAILFFVSMSLQSCEKEGNETNISNSGSTKSHNMGKNCMSCHVSGGDGEGWFTTAGTVYNETGTATLSSGTVKLYSGPNGTGSVKYTISVDGNGNFYTTNDIDFSQDLYPAITGATETKYMGSKISAGACNACHCVTTDKLWTK